MRTALPPTPTRSPSATLTATSQYSPTPPPMTPMGTYTPTATSTAILTPTTTLTALPAKNAQLGTNRGNVPENGGELWTYSGTAGDVVTIAVKADKPANTTGDTAAKLAAGVFDPAITINRPDGIQDDVFPLSRDDIVPGKVTDRSSHLYPACVRRLYYRSSRVGEYHVRGIHVDGRGHAGGGYLEPYPSR